MFLLVLKVCERKRLECKKVENCLMHLVEDMTVKLLLRERAERQPEKEREIFPRE